MEPGKWGNWEAVRDRWSEVRHAWMCKIGFCARSESRFFIAELGCFARVGWRFARVCTRLSGFGRCKTRVILRLACVRVRGSGFRVQGGRQGAVFFGWADQG